MTLGERFWSKVDKNGPVPAHRPELGPCWVWTGSIRPDGYGQYKLAGRMRTAHTVVYEDEAGPIPGGLELDHLCRTHPCVRRPHLEAVTHAENMRRGTLYDLGSIHRGKDRCSNGHLFDEANTRYYRGRRECRACHRDWNRQWRQRNARRS